MVMASLPARKLPQARGSRTLGRTISAGLLCLTVLFSGGWGWRNAGSPPPSAAPAPLASGTVSEVAPPRPTQQLKEVLSAHRPQLTIVAPAPDTVLPAGPWTMELRVADWPLAGTNPGALGPHLVVQRDQERPIRVGATPASRSDEGSVDPRTVKVPMEPLTPGSHRISVYAAYPWGEAVKAPGASTQIRLHRAAANPLGVPQPASPQLIPAIPFDLIQAEPVLIDWLLFDAPLQHLRDGDDSWRLRITLNGDSFLVDRQTPIWLKGLASGESAIQLELLDGRGDPLNPPFNTLVTAVTLTAGASPRWPSAPFNDAELKRALLGGAVATSPTVPSPLKPPAPTGMPFPPGQSSAASKSSSSGQSSDPGPSSFPEELSVSGPQEMERLGSGASERSRPQDPSGSSGTSPAEGDAKAEGDPAAEAKAEAEELDPVAARSAAPSAIAGPSAAGLAGSEPTGKASPAEKDAPPPEREPASHPEPQAKAESETRLNAGREPGPEIQPEHEPENQPARGDGVASSPAATREDAAGDGPTAGPSAAAGESLAVARARFGA